MAEVAMAIQDSMESVAARAREGDRAALGTLAEAYGARLAGLVVARLNAHSLASEDADEILQETWVRACESIGKFAWQGEDSFLRWLGGIAEHVMLDKLRKAAKAPVCRDQMDLPSPAETPSRGVRRQERFERLMQALEKLGPDQKKAIVLVRLKRLPITAVAEQMGRTPDAVAQLLMRAARKLKTLMGETESLSLPATYIDLGEADDGK
jgi:RNA polymerase sigma-70 factor, ECF subfamily